MKEKCLDSRSGLTLHIKLTLHVKQSLYIDLTQVLARGDCVRQSWLQQQ